MTHMIWRTSSMVTGLAVAGLLTACALPLTAGTVLLESVAVAAGVSMSGGEVFLLPGEARQTLTRVDVDAGHLDSDEAPKPDLADWLTSWGITSEQVDQGKVIVVRIGRVEADVPPGPQSGLYLPALRGDLVIEPGTVVELRLGPQWPAEVAALRARTVAASHCSYELVPPERGKTWKTFGKPLGHPRLAATFACPRRHPYPRLGAFAATSVKRDDLPPPRSLSDRVATPSASDVEGLATLLLYRSWSIGKSEDEFLVRVDGVNVSVLENGGCDLVLLAPGSHVVQAGTNAAMRFPRRELTVRVSAGERVVVDYVTDNDNYSGYRSGGGVIFEVGPVSSALET